MKNIIIFTLLLGIILIAGCVKQAVDKPKFNLPKEDGKIWVQIDPVQCLGNTWEVDWMKSHDNNYSAYPRDVHTSELEQEEIQIIKNYYQKQGVTIFEVKSERTHGTVCEACSCPQGYTLYLLVSDYDIDKMLELGYKVSSKQQKS